MLSSTHSVSLRIAELQASFSPAQSRMADYVLTHPFRVATQSIDEFANAAGVSVATANRFARMLGFAGYPLFRAALAKGFEDALAPVYGLKEGLAEPASVADVFSAVFEEDIHNARLSQQNLVPEACEQAVAAIIAARRIYILGFGASGYLAGLLHRGLCVLCEHVESLAGPGGVSQAARQLSRVGTQDLVISIAFPRYLSDTVELTKAARKAGATVLALTDKANSPLVPLADIALYASSARRLMSNSDAATLSLIEALCAAVAYRSENSIHAATSVAQSVMPWLIHGEGENQR